MEKLGEQCPQSPGYRAIDDKRLEAPDYIYCTDKLTFWPKAAAGYQELAPERLKRDRQSVLGSVPKPESSESQKMDANEVVLRVLVKEKLQKKELCRRRYESVSESESESESDSGSHSYSDGDWEWVHYYDFELYPGH